MKKYIGTKEVSAKPMNLGEFVNSYRNPYGEKITEHGENEPGYLVRYEDGYESWSPKEAFEAAYKCSETPLDRMKIEESELFKKACGLRCFTQTENFESLDTTTKGMLKAQLQIMCQYDSLLIACATRMETNVSGHMLFPFGIAIEYLKTGCCVRRSSWNNYDRDLVIIKQVSAHIDSNIIPKMQSLSEQSKEVIMKNSKHLDYTEQCLVYNTNTGRVDSWSPSVADVFAKDWELVD